MPSTTTLLSRIRSDFPQFLFKSGNDFYWSPSDKTIYYGKNDKNRAVFILHELSHALLGHASYKSDVKLIAMERQAWDNTRLLAAVYAIPISEETIQANLDSYRKWLHARSLCPNCETVGIQTKKSYYKCLACCHAWTANEARTCRLKRRSINKKQRNTH